MTKRAAIYTRVSTDEQANSGYSLPTQADACKRYADALGFEVVGVYQDDISGVTPIGDRPDGARLQTLLDTGGAKAVIVYRVDRLYRDDLELRITVRQWLRSGVELHFCDSGKVKGENDIFLIIQGWAGSDEHEKIVERGKRGREAKARGGRAVSSSTTPYGYDYNGGDLTPNQDAATVKMIFEWYTQGNGNGDPLTLHEIRKRLEAMGIKAPGAGVYRRTTPDTEWSATTVRRMLTNAAYMGEWTWGKTRSANFVRDHKPDAPSVIVHIPPIVTRELFDAVQERIAYNKLTARRNRKRDYLLVGHVRCECGFTMAGNFKGDVNYYRCVHSGRGQRGPDGERLCYAKMVRCDVLDPLAWDYAQGVIAQRDDYEANLREAQRRELDALQPKRERLAYVLTLLEDADKEAREIKRALKDARGRVGELLQHDQDEVNARYESLSQERQALETEIAAGALSDEQIAAMLSEYDDTIIIGLENATLEDKRRMFENLRLQVIVTGDKARVSCRLPIPESVISLSHSRTTAHNNTIELYRIYDLPQRYSTADHATRNRAAIPTTAQTTTRHNALQAAI